MMKLINLGETLSIAIPASILLLALSSCQEGPAERIGRSIDTASDSAVDQIERTGNHVKFMAAPDEQITTTSPAYF